MDLIKQRINTPYEISYRDNRIYSLPSFTYNRFQSTDSSLRKYDDSFRVIIDHMKKVDKVIDWLVKRNILPEYQEEISNTFGNIPSYLLKDEEYTEEKADEATSLAYKLITETQSQLNNV